MRTRRFLSAFWQLVKPYWVSEQRGKGITLLATVVGLALGAVWMEVQFNRWNNDFYNTLQAKDQEEFFRQLGLFTLLAFTWIIDFPLFDGLDGEGRPMPAHHAFTAPHPDDIDRLESDPLSVRSRCSPSMPSCTWCHPWRWVPVT